MLLWGHQITLQRRPDDVLAPEAQGKRHFGVVLPWAEWEALGQQLLARGTPLLAPPAVANGGTPQEQGKIYLADPSHNVIEIKTYRDLAATIWLRGPLRSARGVSGGGRIVFGVRPVGELVRARPDEVSVIYVADGTRGPEIEEVVQAAKERRVSVEFRPRRMVADLAPGAVHQGIVAIAGRFRYATLEELLAAAKQAGEPALIVLLDGITDPHNLGAIVRSAEVLGAHGLVIPARGSASVTPGAVKASAGATERVRIAEVLNLLKAIDTCARRACACWARAPATASVSTRSTSASRPGWSSARRGRGCARRSPGAATACSTSRSAARCRR